MKLSKKRALLNSVLSLILCISMLLGTTFAWFTDSVISENNIIKSGRLDAEMYWKNPGEAEWKDASTGAIFNYEYWEPGYVETKCLKLVNAGDLAFQYRLFVVPNNDMAAGLKLAEVLDVYVSDTEISARADISGMTRLGTLAELLVNPNGVQSGVLLPEATKSAAEVDVPTAAHSVGAATVCIALKMQESAGNEYQNQNFGDGFKVQLLATQYSYENDSFGADYDVNAEWPEGGYTGGIPSLPGISAASGTKDVPVDDKGEVTAETTVTTNDADVKATLPAGVKMADGATSASFTKTPKTDSDSNITAGAGEQMTALDVHVGGVAADNTTPIIVDLGKVLPVGMNMGNIALYHVENGVTNKMTQVNTLDELTDHNQFYYDPATGFVTVAMATFSEVTIVAEEPKWEGNFDYSWYAKRTGDNHTIANADQLAAFGAIVGGMNGQTQDSFAGKTVKLIADINLGDKESENNPDLIFYPIGYYNSDGTYERTNKAITSGFKNFEGTFDGNGHTIANFYQNTWEMKGDNNYYDATLQYYRDGMGLFGKVYGGTVKNLTVRNFSSDGEYTTTGTIAAYADGATFENIAIFDCNPRVYNIGNGGIVGCAGWYAKEANLKTTFKNITVDNSNKISALWGSYDVACGGLVGQYYPTSGQTSAGTPKNGGIHMENCHVAAQMDVYNDVCANYQYYAYRYAGILIGSVRENETIDGHSYPKMDGITAEGCTVHFGDWNDYYYCELIDNTTASYTHDYQMSRLTEIKAINGTTITYLDGTTGTVPASGRANYVIVNYTKGHGTENATCYHFKDGKVWNHEDAGQETVNGVEVLKEDKQHIYLEFNNLVTGYGWGVTSKGVGDMDGVTILDREVGNSVEKFAKADTAKASYSNGIQISVGDLFKAATITDPKLSIKDAQVQVTVSPVGEDSTAGGTYVANTTDWTKGTLTFTGVGAATITITDYYFCTPTAINVTVNNREPAEKFETKFTGDFLYRVGNQNAVKLGSLFKAKEGAQIGTVSVTVGTIQGATGTYISSATWTNGTIQFSGTGVVRVTIKDDDNYCTPTVLYLEIVDATNVTGLSGTITGNVALLNDCGLYSLTVSGRNTVYGNGFTATYTGNGQYLNNGLKQGVVTVSENGILDNLRVEASIYPAAYLYFAEAKAGSSDGNNRYYYQLSAVAASGNATISNCYIYGGRTNIYIGGGNVTVKGSVLECGTLANVQIVSSSEHTVAFEDITTIQHRVNATVGDTSKVMLGAGILVGDGDKDNTSATAPAIVLKGDFNQYNWVNADDENAVSDGNAKMIIGGALKATHYNHTINGKQASNLGIIYLNEWDASESTEKIKNDTGLPYEKGTVGLSLAGATATRPVYSLRGATGAQIYSDYENADRNTENGLYKPQFKYSADLGGQYNEKTDGGDEFCYREGDTIKVMFPVGDTKELNLAGFVSIDKYTDQKLNLVVTCKDSGGNTVTVTDGKVNLATDGTYTVTYTVTDTWFYDKDGNAVTKSIKYSWNVTMEVSLKETAIPNASFGFDTSKQVIYYNGNSSRTQFIPFLAGLKIWDYDDACKEYLRFDGDSTEDIYARIESVTCTNDSNAKRSEIALTLTDGGVLKVALYPRATSGGSTYSGSVKVADNVLYFVNAGTTSAKGQQWLIYGYSFTGNNGVEINSGELYIGTAGKDATQKSKPTGNFDPNGGSGGDDDGCVTPDTLITLADGTQVRVDSLTGDEQLLVWNMETGMLDSAPILFVDSESEAEYEIIHLYFSDGTDVKVISEHGFWDYDLNRYVYLDRDAAQYIGHTFAKQNGDELVAVQLTDVVLETELTTAWSPVTVGHLCYFVNGMLSMPGGVGGLFNIFDVDADTMTYDYEALARDMETYGLFTYEELNAIVPLSEDMFNAAGGAYLKISIGKGNLTMDELVNMILRYSVYFE